jgi:uncharacterized circularly permuted ATP-grasp superfamily protein/uncharacterized alpha-E superfamily protein
MEGVKETAGVKRVSGDIYRPGTAAYDEVLDARGVVREHWAEWIGLCEEGGEKVYRNWNKATLRFIREIGVSYSVHRAAGKRGPWSFDPVPWIFGAEEWTNIEAGIAQRVRLCSAILADLYGKQTLLREGVLPLEIVYRDRSFLRPFVRVGEQVRKSGRGGGLPGLVAFGRKSNPVPGVSLAAVDLARGPEGKMWVINQRADCPFGLGFALENRSILSRVLPATFQHCQVHRLASFFRAWRAELEAVAVSGREPRVVILATEGQAPEFETAYLANYLGYVRVVPDDLTVRDQRVWLKTLGGLQPVDVIWRTMPGRMLDPLEGEPGPVFGVPGLFQAMRAGNVTVMNHPGAGVLETPGLHPFLPAIARTLLGEELILPTVATWWCGQPRELAHVLANLSRMVIKGIDIRSGFKTMYGSSMAQEELAALRQRIVSDPGLYVGQEEVHFSTLPCLNDVSLEPRSAILRAYGLQTRAGEVHVLPGGLARASAFQPYIVSTLVGGISKDVWVRSATPTPRHVTLWKPEGVPTAETNPSHIPSRTGENLFWTGRYAERADVTARYLRRVLRNRIEGFEQDSELEERHESFLLQALREVLLIAPRPQGAKKDALGELASLLQDEGRPGSLPSALDAFRRACHEIRDVWSATSLQAIEACADGWTDARGSAKSVFDYYAPLDRLLLDLTAFIGLSLESMTRDAGWCLLDAGRRIERGLLLVELLQHGLARTVEPEVASLVGESVLVIADSLVTFRRRYRRELRPHRVIDLLIYVENNPRSLSYQFDRLEQVLGLLPREAMGKTTNPLSLVRDARKDLQRFTPEGLSAQDPDTGARPDLRDLLKRQRKRLLRISDELTMAYFSHSVRR